MSIESRLRQSWFGPIRVPHSADPDWQPIRPRGHFRGRRGYYRRLHREAATFAVKPTGWYDYMHWHVDWTGLGNGRWKERREHLTALFTMFHRLLHATANWPTPHQAWLQIDAYDGSQDAVYLHTANPNSENFPNEFPGVQWDVAIPERLRAFVIGPSWQFGRLDQSWTHFIVRPRPGA